MKKSSLFNPKTWSSIHHPLPRTPRESQQLLGALTSSFRRQLDHEYPTSAAPERTNKGGEHSVRSDSAAHMADQHFENILENPLFRVAPLKERKPGVPAYHERITREPMVVFDEWVASGLMTNGRLALCLKSQYLLSTTGKHTKHERTQALKATRAGSKVVSWWFASEPAVREKLFASREATKYLFKFLVAEGMQDTVMGWLRMFLGPDHEVPSRSLHQDNSLPFLSRLADFLHAEVECGRGLGSAVTYFTQSCQLASTLAGKPDGEYSETQRRKLKFAGFRLNRLVVGHYHTQATKLPVSPYEEYMEFMFSLALNNILNDALFLYHPTHPDAGPFLRQVEQLSSESLEPGIKRQFENARGMFIQAGFHALRLLIDQERFGDATRLAPYIQRLLNGEDASDTTPDASYRVSDEEERLLDRLQFSLT